MSGKIPLLERLALHRPPMRAWAMYDWANSAMFTVVISAVFPIFFRNIAADGLGDDEKRRLFSLATTISLLLAALISPVLGAIADVARVKKKLFSVFLVLGVASTASMFWIGRGEALFAVTAFGLCNIGAAASMVFYDSLLSHVAGEDEMDQLSTSAYAVGYLGGGLCLLLCVLLIKHPPWFGLADDKILAQRISFLIVAVWWGVFTIPFLLRVSEPELPLERDERPNENPVRAGFVRIGETLRELKVYRAAFLFMLAFLVFNDGIGTIIRMATLFGDERKIPQETMVSCILLAQFVAIPATIFFGRLANWIGPKRAILIALGAYIAITCYAYSMKSEGEFVTMAICIGLVQGGAQALSRSLFASLVPKHKSGEFFGLFSTLEKFAGVLGPLLFGVSATSGGAILSLIGFFVVGGTLLCFVDVEAGRKQARAVEAALLPA